MTRTGTLYQSTGTEWIQINTGGVSLPPWFDYRTDFALGIVPSSGGGDTDPTDTVNSAWTMVQTVDGTPWNMGGSVSGLDTVLGDYHATVVTDGVGKSGGSTNGDITVSVSADEGSYFPASGTEVIGFGAIFDSTSSAYFDTLIENGDTEIVPNLPDTSVPPDAGSFLSQNRARWASSNGGTFPGWPFTYAASDVFTGTYIYPLAAD